MPASSSNSSRSTPEGPTLSQPGTQELWYQQQYHQMGSHSVNQQLDRNTSTSQYQHHQTCLVSVTATLGYSRNILTLLSGKQQHNSGHQPEMQSTSYVNMVFMYYLYSKLAQNLMKLNHKKSNII